MFSHASDPYFTSTSALQHFSVAFFCRGMYNTLRLLAKMRTVPILMQFYIIAPVPFHVNTYMEILFYFYQFFQQTPAAGKGARFL